MELMTQDLPSGNPYKFQSLHLNPMFFGQIIEYLENVPKDPVEKFYFDYKLVQQDDPNVDLLLLSDLSYVVFVKKAISISESLRFRTSAICPKCGSEIRLEFDQNSLRFNRLDESALNGFIIQFNGKTREVRMPTMAEFMTIFINYRRYKKITDLKIIKLISLFVDAQMYQQIIENEVINSKYDDITTLAMLDQLYFNTISPVTGYCSKCNEGITDVSKMRGTEISIESLISNLFRDILENNRLDSHKIIPREIRQVQ